MVANDLMQICTRIVNIVRFVSKHLKVWRMTLFFKVDRQDWIFLLTASEFTLTKMSKEERGYNPVVPVTDFLISKDFWNFRSCAPKLGDGIKISAKIISQCTWCGLKVPEYKLVAVPFKLMAE